MPEKEWYTQREIAEMLGIEVRKLYPVVMTLRRAGTIATTPDPRDERAILIHRDGIEIVRRALRLDTGTASA
jgi:DNA-binding MarR family transcriptional regulator